MVNVDSSETASSGFKDKLVGIVSSVFSEKLGRRKNVMLDPTIDLAAVS